MDPVVKANDKFVQAQCKLTVKSLPMSKIKIWSIHYSLTHQFQQGKCNPVSYQIIPFAGGTHPVVPILLKMNGYLNVWTLWILGDTVQSRWTLPWREIFTTHDTGLGQFIGNNENIETLWCGWQQVQPMWHVLKNYADRMGLYPNQTLELLWPTLNLGEDEQNTQHDHH